MPVTPRPDPINIYLDVLEDIGIIERMQKGRAVDGFDGGVLSPYWDPVLQLFAVLTTEAIAASSVSES